MKSITHTLCCITLTGLLTSCFSQGVNQTVKVEQTGDVIKRLIDTGLIQAPGQGQNPKASVSSSATPPVSPAALPLPMKTGVPTGTSQPSAPPSVQPTAAIPASTPTPQPAKPTLTTIKVPGATGLITDVVYKGNSTIAVSTEISQVAISENGGKTWESRNFSGMSKIRLAFRGNTLIAGKDEGLFQWNPDKHAWQLLSTGFTSYAWGQITFFNDSDGLMSLSDGTLVSTHDGGKLWAEVGRVGTGSSDALEDQIFITDPSRQTAIVISAGGVFFYDGTGLQNTGVSFATYGSAAVQGKTTWLFGAGTYKSDGEAAFSPIKTQLFGDRIADVSSSAMDALAFADDTGMVLYGGEFYLTQDGGQSWQSTGLKVPLRNTRLFGQYAVKQSGQLLGFACDRSASTLMKVTIPL